MYLALFWQDSSRTRAGSGSRVLNKEQQYMNYQAWRHKAWRNREWRLRAWRHTWGKLKSPQLVLSQLFLTISLKYLLKADYLLNYLIELNIYLYCRAGHENLTNRRCQGRRNEKKSREATESVTVRNNDSNLGSWEHSPRKTLYYKSWNSILIWKYFFNRI